MPSIARILELSSTISATTQQLHDSFIAQNLPFPSFEEDVTLTLPFELDGVRDRLLDSTSELHDLLYGFQNILSSYGSVCISQSLQSIVYVPSTLMFFYSPVTLLNGPRSIACLILEVG